MPILPVPPAFPLPSPGNVPLSRPLHRKTVSVKQSVPPLKAGSLLSSFCCSGGMEVWRYVKAATCNLRQGMCQIGGSSCKFCRTCLLFYDLSVLFFRRQVSGRFSLHGSSIWYCSGFMLGMVSSIWSRYSKSLRLFSLAVSIIE